MTIIQLEYLLAVANYGNYSAAAKHCFVTQPSLSMQINNLEEELGVILLDRNSKPIVPTETGVLVLEQAKEAVAAFYSTKEKVSGLKGELSGKLRLGIIPTISPYLLPKFFPKFIKRCPKVELEIRDMFTADIIDFLSRDLIDVAILAGGDPIRIKEINLFDDKLYFYVSPKSEWYHHTHVAIDEVDIKHVAMLSEGNCMRNQVLKSLCLNKKAFKSQYNFVNCSLDTLMHFVDINDSAITIIPSMAIDYIPKERLGQIKPFAKANAHRKITMSVGRTYVKELIVKAVKDSLMEVSKELAIANFVRS